MDQGYFPERAKSIFIADNPEEKEAAKREFEREGLNLKNIDGSCYLEEYLSPREELEEWVRTKVEAWYHGICILAKIAKWYPQSVYDSLGMLLQIEWQYLQRTVPGVGSLMGPIEDSLREALFHESFGGEDVRTNLR